MANTPYVKFLRGTPSAYAALTPKDNDTLYFIAAEGATYGKMYLGDILVAGNVTADGTDIIDSLGELIDVDLIGLETGQVLGYDGSKWVPMTLPEAVTSSVMIGASADTAGAAGLVPAPKAGDHTKFLRGDGTWAEVATTDVDLSKYATTETVNAIDTRVSELEEDQDAMQNSITWGIL